LFPDVQRERIKSPGCEDWSASDDFVSITSNTPHVDFVEELRQSWEEPPPRKGNDAPRYESAIDGV